MKPTSIKTAVLWALLFALLQAGQVQADHHNLNPPFERTEVRVACTNYEPTKQPVFRRNPSAHGLLVRRGDARHAQYPGRGLLVRAGWSGGFAALGRHTHRRADRIKRDHPNTRSYVTEHPYCMPGENCQFMAHPNHPVPRGAGRSTSLRSPTTPSNSARAISAPSRRPKPAPAIRTAIRPSPGRNARWTTCAVRRVTTAPCATSPRDELSRLRSGAAASIFAGLENVSQNPRRPEFCGPDGLLCERQAKLVWDKDSRRCGGRLRPNRLLHLHLLYCLRIHGDGRQTAGARITDALPCWDQSQDNAILDVPDAGWSSSADCPSGAACINNFSGNSGADNLHRNVIFRNDDVIDSPISNVDSPLGCGYGIDCTSTPDSPVASPAVMLQRLMDECIDNPDKPRCDVIAIPHNPNLSGGSMFLIPENSPDGLAEASLRNQLEPAGRADADQGPVGMPLQRHDRDGLDEPAGRIVRLREPGLGAAWWGSGRLSHRRDADHRKHSAPQLRAQHARQRHCLRRRARDKSFPARVRWRA